MVWPRDRVEGLAEEDKTEVAPGHVHVGEVGGVGLVEVVVAFQGGGTGCANCREEEAAGGEMLVWGRVGEAADEGAEESCL